MAHEHWPRLSFSESQDTYAALHLWSQAVGKVRLARTPWANHSWHVPLYVGATGLTTSFIPHGRRGFQIDLDLIDHDVRIATTDGERLAFPLQPMSVADFHRLLMQALEELGVATRIWPHPVELPDPVTPFPDDDAPRPYDADAVEALWRAMLQAHRVFTEFRAGFVGKASPVHLFWGAFDVAVTRFSGRPAPPHPGGAPNCADWVMTEAYSHELSSAGFWAGAGLGEAAFYSYAYPEPHGFRDREVRPDAAFYHEDLGEFVLPYEAVRTADDPDATLHAFLRSTYEAAADAGRWDRPALERTADAPGGAPVGRRARRGRT